MSRKSWSNFFIFIATLNLAASVVPANPMKIANWIAIPCCLVLGTLARRRMIPKSTSPALAPMRNEIGSVQFSQSR